MIDVNHINFDDPVSESEVIDRVYQDEKFVKIKKIKFALNNDQRKDLLDIAKLTNYKHYLMIRVMLESGLRVNELVNLIIYDLNLVECYIEVQSRLATKYHGSFKTKTKSSNRIIPITHSLSRELKAYIGNRKTGYLFVSRKNNTKFFKNSVIAFINKYAKICNRISKKMGSHALRRTYASYLLVNKIPIDRISKILGHSSVRTTLIYLFEISDLEFDAIRDVVNKMNKGVK